MMHDALCKLNQQGMMHELPHDEHVHYVTTNMKSSLFLSQAKRWTVDLVHGEMCGPITPTTPSGKQYFFVG